MEYVRRQMGHRSITTTIRAYGHMERTMVADAAARAEAPLLDAAPPMDTGSVETAR
jgi:integrase